MHADTHVDAVLAQCVRDQLADRRVLPVDQPAGGLNQHHRRAKASEELAQLNTDGPSTDDHDARRQFLDSRRFAVRPVARLLNAIDRRDARVAAGGDHDPIGFQNRPSDLHASRAGDPRVAAEHLHALVSVAALLLAVVEIADHEITVLSHLRPVRARLRDTRHAT